MKIFEGLLTHMEHMRMDPKHQFAAQYMLSRAAAERREQIAANLLSIAQNSRGASPALSDTSSCNERLSPPPENLHNNTSGNNNNNNSNNNNNNNNTNVNNDGNPGINESASDNNNNTNGATNPLSLNNAAAYNHKHPMNDVLRSQGTGGQLHHQYQQVVANALSAAAQNQNSCNGLVSPVNPSTSAAQAISSLVAMRQTQSHGMNGSQQPSPTGPYHHNSQSITNHQNNPHHHHQDQSDAAMRIQEALRSQAEAALRLAVSQAAAVVASNGNTTNEISSNNQYRHNNAYGHQSNSINNLQSQFVGPDLSEALRLQEQRIEQALRLHNNELGLHQQQHQHP
jgi:zinc finger protein 362/384